MYPRIFNSVLCLSAAALLLVCTIMMQPLQAQVASDVSEELSKAINFYSELEFDKGLELTQSLLAGGLLDAKDSIAVYAVTSMLTFGKGKEFENKSYRLLETMAGIGPCKIPLPYDFWPQQLRDRWYSIAKEKGALVCEQASTEITTIAIMEFDNFSVGKYQEELGFVTKGLADFFEVDFSKISSLRVVERDKIEFILDELKLSQEGMVSSSTAIKVGKLLGAQIMVFGSVTQLDSRNAKMLIKAVKVETSEIIAAVDKDGRPNFFKMQKELVKELAGKLDVALDSKTEKLLDEGGTESYDAATLYSKGLYFMDRYEYKKAYEFFKSAYDLDNSFVEAKQKMDIYRPLAS